MLEFEGQNSHQYCWNRYPKEAHSDGKTPAGKILAHFCPMTLGNRCWYSQKRESLAEWEFEAIQATFKWWCLCSETDKFGQGFQETFWALQWSALASACFLAVFVRARALSNCSYPSIEALKDSRLELLDSLATWFNSVEFGFWAQIVNLGWKSNCRLAIKSCNFCGNCPGFRSGVFFQ